MKILFSLLFLTLFNYILLGQQDATTEHKPLKINSSLIVDNIYNIDGGNNTGRTTLGLFDFSIDYSPSANGFLRNTNVYAHLLKTTGKGASENYIGDVQVASNIEGRASRFIYELYIKQQINDFSFLLGLHDLNSEFMASNYAADFINSSFGIFPAISLNVPVSIFPVTTIGSIVSFNKKSFNIVTGIYNLNHDYIEEEKFNINNHLYHKGFLGVLEMRYRFSAKNNLNGEYKIGGYFTNCRHHEESQHHDDCRIEKNRGVYFIADQTLWSSSNSTQMGMFAQIGLTPKETNYVPDYYGLGISLRTSDKKFFPELIGLAFGTVALNQFNEDESIRNVSRETAIELSIKKEWFSIISIQPDIQYIINPSGIYSNAFVGTLRLQIDLNNLEL